MQFLVEQQQHDWTVLGTTKALPYDSNLALELAELLAVEIARIRYDCLARDQDHGFGDSFCT